MSDRTLVNDFLIEMLGATDKIIERCASVSSVDELLTKNGQIILDSICMQLIALGEGVKKLDNLTQKKLLSNYPEVNWRAVAAMRDILSHHYFDLNAETVYGVCIDDIERVRNTLHKIIKDYNIQH